MITSAHPPDDDRIFFKEARSLARIGADVTILYPEGKPAPAGRAGVRFSTYAGGGSLSKRLRTTAELYAAASDLPADVIHCHEPDSLKVGIKLKSSRKVGLVFDSHELWAGVAAQRMPSLIRSLTSAVFRKLEKGWLLRCDAAIGASVGISEYLSSVMGAERVETLLNVPVTDVFKERTRAVETDGRVVICHDGYLTFDRGLRVMAEAVRLVSIRHPVRFKIVGDVFGEEATWLNEFVRENGLEDVITRTGWLPYERVGEALADCHLGLIALSYAPNHVVAAPNKAFNYLMYGIPFVGPEFVESFRRMASVDRCCALADSADPRSFADAICRLIEDRSRTEEMAGNALRASRQKYRWEHMEPVLFGLYSRVLGATG